MKNYNKSVLIIISIMFFVSGCGDSSGAGSTGGPVGTGISGSTTQFAIKGDIFCM